MENKTNKIDNVFFDEKPDRWVILKLPNNYYKVFATWFGGYLDGDSWRLNSGIKDIQQDDENYFFIGFSGSVYKCGKENYGTATSFTVNVLNKILEQAKGEIQLLENVDDWSDFIFNKK